MKKIFLIGISVFFVFLLTSCNKITIEPGVINIVFENPHYDGTSFYVDAYITNGLEEDTYIGNIDVALHTKDSEVEIASAAFLIDVTIQSGNYFSVELEFLNDYVFITKEEFEQEQYDFKTLELSFAIYE